jgi:hypothetical protein
MSVDGLSPFIPSSTSMLAPVSDWGTRLIAPLGSSLISKDGMIELAGRTYWIFGLVIAAVVVAREYGYLTGRATPTASSSTGAERSQLQAKHSTLLKRIDERVHSSGYGCIGVTDFWFFTRLERQLMRLNRQHNELIGVRLLGSCYRTPEQVTQQLTQIELQRHDILLQIDQQTK